MGLPGSGKTTFVENLKHLTNNFAHYNADEVRKKYDDWDFSDEGSRRQAERMRALSDKSTYYGQHSIVEFICPKVEYRRNIIQPDILIWMNTISEGQFDDTNKMFEPPKIDQLIHPSSIFIIENYDYGNILNYLCDVIDRKF